MRLSLMSAVLCVAAVPTTALSAAGETEQAILSDCGGARLAASVVDICLERARILDETNPSPRIESLIARLETDATGRSEGSPGSAVTDQAPDAERSTGVSQARSLPRPLEGGAAVASAPDRAKDARSADQAGDDDDGPPIDDASPSAGGSSDQEGVGVDNGDSDDDEPPVDDAPHR